RRIYFMSMTKAASDCSPKTLAVMRALEPNFPWRGGELRARRDCYATLPDSDLAARAQRELDEYNQAQPSQLLPAP
ncbi:MAG: hypothetical protein ABI837_08455, partial [Acidobacteriota bacterium]